MGPHSCPYCYESIGKTPLWFQCKGRGSPGRPGCEAVQDDERLRLTDFNEPARPVFPPPEGVRARRTANCKWCGGETGIRACPHCHTPLPINFGESTGPMIAMVGAKRTGKTVYMTVLAHELRSTIRRRFDADVRLTGEGRGGFRSTHQWLEANEQTVFKSKQLFQATPAAEGGRRDPLVFEWRQEVRRHGRRRLATSYLSFYDTAGEDQTDLIRAQDQRYLGAADALILLLDPFELPNARSTYRIDYHAEYGIREEREHPEHVVNRITDVIRQNRKVPSGRLIDIPLAVAFAKMDAIIPRLQEGHALAQRPPNGSKAAYDETLGRKTDEHVRTLLKSLDADGIDNHLRLNFKNYRYFSISALGREPNYEQRTVSDAGVMPLRVDEPLVWLLSQFNIVESHKF